MCSTSNFLAGDLDLHSVTDQQLLYNVVMKTVSTVILLPVLLSLYFFISWQFCTLESHDVTILNDTSTCDDYDLKL